MCLPAVTWHWLSVLRPGLVLCFGTLSTLIAVLPVLAKIKAKNKESVKQHVLQVLVS